MADNRVYVVGDSDGLMLVLDAADGQTIWSYQLDPLLLQTIYPSPLLVNEEMVYVAHNESLYAIRAPNS